jgi:hypothetical protein
MDLCPGLVPASIKTQVSGCDEDERGELGQVKKAHLEHLSNGIEQPPVRVDLLLIFGLENKNDLDGD